MTTVELVDVTTEDGLLLTGAFHPSSPDVRGGAGIDAVLMIHGNGSNFYSPYQREFAGRLAKAGLPVLAANTRGHGMLSTSIRTSKGPADLIGTSMERIDECLMDLDAWLHALRNRGAESILLWAHSRGAVKAAFYLAKRQPSNVRCVVLSSPPLLSYQRWIASAKGSEFKAQLATCAAAVQSGAPDALVPVTVPMSYLSGASQYLDTYGPDEKYHLLDLLASTSIPVLATTGSVECETMLPFQGLDDILNERASLFPSFEHYSVHGGDHVYTGKRQEVVDHVLAWLRRACSVDVQSIVEN